MKCGSDDGLTNNTKYRYKGFFTSYILFFHGKIHCFRKDKEKKENKEM